MSDGHTSLVIIALGSQNTFLHVYDDERQLLADDDIGAGVGESRFPLEFFDSDGYRLAGVYDGDWRLTRLVRTADEPNQDALQRRIHQVTKHLRAAMEANPKEVELLGLRVSEALGFFPEPDDSQDLTASLRPFYFGAAHRKQSAFSGVVEYDFGSMRHNAAHIFGNPHKK